MTSQDEQWYFHPATGEVSKGKTGGWENRMGPYSTEEAARNALEIASERSKAFDEQDEDWSES